MKQRGLSDRKQHRRNVRRRAARGDRGRRAPRRRQKLLAYERDGRVCVRVARAARSIRSRGDSRGIGAQLRTTDRSLHWLFSLRSRKPCLRCSKRSAGPAARREFLDRARAPGVRSSNGIRTLPRPELSWDSLTSSCAGSAADALQSCFRRCRPHSRQRSRRAACGRRRSSRTGSWSLRTDRA